jgi:hypothetical protein
MPLNSFARSVIEWWSRRRPKPLNQLLVVEWSDEQVDVRVLERLEPGWNQSFKWSDVVRVCFKDAGLYSSDVLIIEVKGKERPIVVLTEAKGGSEFFGALADRGLFPEAVWRRAIGETGGGVHCWPPTSA